MEAVKGSGRWYLLLASVAAAMLAVAGCAPQAQINMLERNIAGLQVENERLTKQVQELQQQVKAVTGETGSYGEADIRKVVANLKVRVDALESEMLRINGFLEQVKYRQDQQEQELQKQRELIQDEINKLRKELSLVQTSAETAREVEETRKKVEEGRIDLYQKGLELFKQEKFQEAKQVLKAYIQQNPEAPLVANAYFWIGECEYKSNRFEEAILEYQKVISNYPESNKVPDALLKQGFAFARLGDVESARIVLKKLLKAYPNSPQAKVARKQLARLK